MIYTDIDTKLKIKKIDDLFDMPNVILVNEFSEKSAKEFRDNFAKAVNTGQKIIPIVIDSFGGQVYSLLSIIATIKASPVPVATIGMSKMMSCASVLMTCGADGYRFADPLSTMLIHEVSSWAHGKVSEITASADETERLNALIFKIMASNIGKPEDYFTKLIHDKNHADIFMNAEDMKSHNLINHIRIPSFKVKISTDVSFG